MYARIPAPDGLYDDNCQHDKQETNTSSQKASIELIGSKPSIPSSSSSSITLQTRPKNVSLALWEKFKVLEKRTNDVTKRSTEKRIKQLRQQVLAKVQEEITHPDDLDILRAHDVRLGPPNIREKGKGKKRHHDEDTQKSVEDSSSSRSSPKWGDIKKLLTVNDHLKGIDYGEFAAKTDLEKTVDKAVHSGDYEKAEELSDRLANREFGKKIADAFDARNYLIKKKEEEESIKSKRKKKLQWGFVEKQRWETKGNM